MVAAAVRSVTRSGWEQTAPHSEDVAVPGHAVLLTASASTLALLRSALLAARRRPPPAAAPPAQSSRASSTYLAAAAERSTVEWSVLAELAELALLAGQYRCGCQPVNTSLW